MPFEMMGMESRFPRERVLGTLNMLHNITQLSLNAGTSRNRADETQDMQIWASLPVRSAYYDFRTDWTGGQSPAHHLCPMILLLYY